MYLFYSEEGVMLHWLDFKKLDRPTYSYYYKKRDSVICIANVEREFTFSENAKESAAEEALKEMVSSDKQYCILFTIFRTLLIKNVYFVLLFPFQHITKQDAA